MRTAKKANVEIVKGFLIATGEWSLLNRLRLGWRVLTKKDARQYKRENTPKKTLPKTPNQKT
ncbi:MAG: hypothetical protein IPJ01_12195 [Micavibrio sp.]|nr:hypothetical protein [Micavibrio sp.]